MRWARGSILMTQGHGLLPDDGLTRLAVALVLLISDGGITGLLWLLGATIAQALAVTVGTGMAGEMILMPAAFVLTALVSIVSMKHFERPAAAFVRNLFGRHRAAPVR